MDIQRNRLLEDLEEAENLDERIKLERFISNIDDKLLQLFSKMISSGIKTLQPTVNLHEILEIKEDVIKEFVKNLISSNGDPDSQDMYYRDDLEFEFIKQNKCNVEFAQNVIRKMMQDGLSLCMEPINLDDWANPNRKYYLGKFAMMRGYLN